MDALVKRGWEVVVLDNLLTGSLANLQHLEGACVQFLNQDVSNHVAVEGAVDWVMHLASPASPIDFPTYPIQIVKVGTLGTHNLLGLAKSKGAKFFLASTSEVYGDPLVHPQPETYWGNVNPIGRRGCYDEAKRAAEAFTMAYQRKHGIDTRIIRIFNTYGPRMRLDDGRVLPNFMTQALRGEPLTVYGDGSQTRSLTYVDDLVAGILAIVDRGDHLPYNIGSQDEVTMLQLARRIIALTGSRSEVAFRPLPEDDPTRRRPDTTRASQMLGWAPQTDLDQGLQRTLDYFRAAL